jgi:hypothetical protein
VCPNEFDQDAAEIIRHVRNQPVFISTEVENHAVIADEIDSGTELTFQVIRAIPTRLGCNRKPSATGSFGLRVSLPELLERLPSDHLHKN